MKKISLGMILLAGTLHGHGSHSHGAPLHDHEHCHHDDEIIALSDEQVDRAGIEVTMAKRGLIQRGITVPGKVIPNPERYSHIVPYTEGIVRSVSKNVGDPVRAGEVLAVIESKEVAEVRGEYIAAVKQRQYLEGRLERERNLREKQYSAENDYRQAEYEAEEAGIRAELAKQKLRTLGIRGDYIDTTENLGIYPLRAPFDGTVVSRHLSLGEHVETSQEAFIVADLSEVWVELSLYPKDLSSVRVGDKVRISGDHEVAGIGMIARISPMMDSGTKRITGIAKLENTSGEWRPGEYVCVCVEGDAVKVGVAIPKSAILLLENEESVFVRGEHGFSPRKILTGQRDNEIVEVSAGLHAGERVVTKNAVLLKFELMKGEHED